MQRWRLELAFLLALGAIEKGVQEKGKMKKHPPFLFERGPLETV